MTNALRMKAVAYHGWYGNAKITTNMNINGFAHSVKITEMGLDNEFLTDILKLFRT